MNIIAHLKIAHLIQKKLSSQHGIHLNRLGFLLGNILPDLQHNRIQAEHFFRQSWLQIQLLAGQIGSEQQDLTPGRLTRFHSVNIGMVCHFVSDYFCFAHTVHFKQTFLNHLAYEARQSFIPLSQLARVSEGSDAHSYPSALWTITLQQAVDQHTGQQPSMAQDLHEAIKNGTRVAALLALQAGIQRVPGSTPYLPIPEVLPST